MKSGISGLISIFPILLTSGLVVGCGKHEPTRQELREAAKIDREYAAELEAETQFNKAQSALWAKPVTSLTAEILINEIQKCKRATSGPGAAAVYFEDTDLDKALANLKSGVGSVTIVGQRRMPIGGVRMSDFICYFKGAGFERFSDQTIGYTEEFIS